MVNPRRLFVCSCIALVTSAFTFSLSGAVMQDLGTEFNFTQTQNGGINQARFWGMAASLALGGFICDLLGMKRIMVLALLSHLVGTLGIVFSRNLLPEEVSTSGAYWWLYAFSIIMGCGNGFTEVGINPLAATLYPKEKTHYLNILHAWWPGGLIIGGLLAIVVRNQLFANTSEIFGLNLWQFSLLLIVVPAVVYGLMLLRAEFPHTERVESGISTGDMMMQALRPMFLLWAACMLLTACTELGPQQWQESVMQRTAGISGTGILVYTSGLMFVLRHFAGPIAHRLSPVGLLTVSAALSAVGLYLLSFADNAATAFGYATIFGLGIAYFWPTMLGVAAERFPKGGALVLALMGTAGNAAIAFILPEMGRIVDHYTVQYVETKAPEFSGQLLQRDDSGRAIALDARVVDRLSKEAPDSAEYSVARDAQKIGFSMAFRLIAILPCVLVVVFGAIALYDKARGGYRPELLLSRAEEDELYGGGVQAAVE